MKPAVQALQRKAHMQSNGHTHMGTTQIMHAKCIQAERVHIHDILQHSDIVLGQCFLQVEALFSKEGDCKLAQCRAEFLRQLYILFSSEARVSVIATSNFPYQIDSDLSKHFDKVRLKFSPCTSADCLVVTLLDVLPD